MKLAQNEHLVMKREQLLQAVWGYHYFGDSRTVDTHIKSLRDRLGHIGASSRPSGASAINLNIARKM